MARLVPGARSGRTKLRPTLRRINWHGTIGPSLGAGAVNTIVRDLAVRVSVPSADTVTAHSLPADGATVAYAADVLV